ncbi:hypothetical protein C8T65DRAFT_738759 [Cerioporus squamosus]|nr:hypothetical protein C8T65DRAFT_738759 [Cerioporus squamosus]
MAAALCDDRPLEVMRVPNSRAPPALAVISTSDIDIKAILRKAGWKDVEDEEYDDLVENLRRNLNRMANQVSSGPVHSVDESVSSTVHCECALLAHLHDQGIEDIVAYVGVSKHPCWLCAMYFACYREVTGSVINVRETHGQLVQWQIPSLKDSGVDADLRRKMCEKLMEKLKVQAQVVRTRHRKASQSTMAALEPAVLDLPPPTADPQKRRATLRVNYSMFGLTQEQIEQARYERAAGARAGVQPE